MHNFRWAARFARPDSGHLDRLAKTACGSGKADPTTQGRDFQSVVCGITAWSAYQQKIATAAACGALPDIIFRFSKLVAGIAARGLLADPSEFFDPDDLVPATVELSTWNGT